LTEAEKGQVELRKALAEKEVELVAAHKEVAEEHRRSADTDHLRGKLRTVEADIMSLQRRHGILRSDLEEARSKEKQMEKAFDGMKTDIDQLRKRWEQVQARLVAEVERTNAENAGLNQAMTEQQAELDKARKEREAAERRHRQKQAELGLAQLELAVAKDDVQKAQAGRDDMLKENDRLRKELGNRAFTAQANLKRIVERFRAQTTVAIQAATATALQSWAEQAVELQVLRADKANRDLRGPGFWKLDQAYCEAVQKNLTTDLLRLAVSHQEEITKLLEFQDKLVDRMRKEMEIVAEPVVKTCDAEAVGRSRPKYSEAERELAGEQGTQNDGRQMYQKLTITTCEQGSLLYKSFTGLTGVRRLHYLAHKEPPIQTHTNIQ
jgi:chromosome segregation ATPase